VGGSLPQLASLYERFKDKRDRFEIIAFHDKRAKSFAELDEKLTQIVENRWEGRPLPFPILLDASGDTILRYGIHAFPTHVLIDPQGRIVGESSAAELESILSE
jgi:AhpC/TSA family protein